MVNHTEGSCSKAVGRPFAPAIKGYMHEAPEKWGKLFLLTVGAFGITFELLSLQSVPSVPSQGVPNKSQKTGDKLAKGRENAPERSEK